MQTLFLKLGGARKELSDFWRIQYTLINISKGTTADFFHEPKFSANTKIHPWNHSWFFDVSK
jgi:hypothetical protein